MRNPAYETLLRAAFERIQELDRRVAGHVVRGKVKERDIAKKKVRLLIGKDDEGEDVLSPWVPYAQIAGDLKVHTPPSVGQNMVIKSETGDLQQGTAFPHHWNNDNKSPSDKEDENVLTYGGIKLTLDAGKVLLEIDGTTFEWSGEGFVQTGGKIEHDGHLIDKTHVHTEVITGADLSGPPP